MEYVSRGTIVEEESAFFLCEVLFYFTSPSPKSAKLESLCAGSVKTIAKS